MDYHHTIYKIHCHFNYFCIIIIIVVISICLLAIVETSSGNILIFSSLCVTTYDACFNIWAIAINISMMKTQSMKFKKSHLLKALQSIGCTRHMRIKMKKRENCNWIQNKKYIKAVLCLSAHSLFHIHRLKSKSLKLKSFLNIIQGRLEFNQIWPQVF